MAAWTIARRDDLILPALDRLEKPVVHSDVEVKPDTSVPWPSANDRGGQDARVGDDSSAGLDDKPRVWGKQLEQAADTRT